MLGEKLCCAGVGLGGVGGIEMLAARSCEGMIDICIGVDGDFGVAAKS
ncbi:uncharacterized protein METZ01_LOCUS406011, partial [marine metagenome]